LREEAKTLFEEMARRVVPPPSEDSPMLHSSHANDATVALILLSFGAPQPM
jgi:hypothetical protein